MTEVAIGGDGCRLTLRVRAYEFPDSHDVDDGNWLLGEAELEAGTSGSFKAFHPVTLRADELAQFRDELAPLIESLSGDANLRHLEEQVGCEITLKEGKGTMKAFLSEHVGSELRVRDCETDHSFLTQTLRDLNALLSKFPVRGKRVE